MNNRIIVIHPSEIIRQGLHSIVKNLFDIDAVLLGQIEELKSYVEIRKMRILLLVDSQLNNDQFTKTAEVFKKYNSVKIVLLRDSFSKSNCKGDCDCCFSIIASKSRIFEIIDPYLQQDSNSNARQHVTELTERETDVIKQVALGKTNKEIAATLFISFHTVISHRKNITEKLGIKSISGLTVYAILNKLIDTNTIDPESLI